MTAAQIDLFEGASAPPPSPSPTEWRSVSVPRYRLSLVREGGAEYSVDAAPLARPATAATWLWDRVFAEESREVLAVVMVDTKYRPLGLSVAYTGTLSRTAVEPRGVLVPALLSGAASIIIAHNHPSEDPSPSLEDIAFTRRLAEAGEAVGVTLLDHFVVGNRDRWVSLKERGAWS